MTVLKFTASDFYEGEQLIPPKAIQNDDLSIVQQFPASDFYEGEQLILAKAIQNADLAEVQRLALQTDLHTLGKKKMTILHLAIFYAINDYRQPRLDIITALMRAGANYLQTAPPSHENNTPTYWALGICDERPLILKAMLDAGLPPNGPNSPPPYDHPMIFDIMIEEMLEGVKLLLAYGAQINIQSSVGDTPLSRAYSGGIQPKLSTYLLEQGANPEIPDILGFTVSNELYKDLQDLQGFPPEHPLRKELKKLAVLIQSKGYTWPPLTPLQQRDAMRARGETPLIPKGQSR